MTPNELMADVCARDGETMKMTLADFSDADMLVRPCPGAKHAAWMLGHLIGSEVFFLKSCGAGAVPELPAGFSERFTEKTVGSDQPSAFLTKAALLDLFSKVRAASVNWIRTLDEKAMNRPGPERLRELVPTVGHTVCLISSHMYMHLGQMQAIRRRLGKPVLF